jgi:LPPG:FO 2-phospho-L-lactate transferase
MTAAGRVVLLSGGTGGARLARGMRDVCDELTVVANTGDDIDVYGVHVCPDPDLVTFSLADALDERGWGLRGDTWAVMEAFERAGWPHWFKLGDRDLAMSLIRTERMRRGHTLTEAHAAVVEAMGAAARVLPMSDQRVATWVGARGRRLPFQEFMIVGGGAGPVEAVELRGVHRAHPSDAVLAALAQAETIVIGPSNPVISIGPILALPGMREALCAAPAPVVAVSPFVGGRSLKGPSEAFCEFAEIPLSADGIAGAYEGVADGVVGDDEASALPSLTTDTVMDSPEARERLARETLEFAAGLAA